MGHAILRRSNEIAQMMKVIGEEGTSLKDYVEYLKGDFFDFIYLQQNAFDPVDEATSKERQIYVFGFICQILNSEYKLQDKAAALHFFQQLRQLLRSWNSAEYGSQEFGKIEEQIVIFLEKNKSEKES